MVGNEKILKVVINEGEGGPRSDKRSINLGDEF